MKKNIKEFWNGSSFCTYNRNFTKENLNGDCKECKYGKKCKGGCLSVSKGVTGKNNADPYCFKSIETDLIKT